MATKTQTSNTADITEEVKYRFAQQLHKELSLMSYKRLGFDEFKRCATGHSPRTEQEKKSLRLYWSLPNYQHSLVAQYIHHYGTPNADTSQWVINPSLLSDNDWDVINKELHRRVHGSLASPRKTTWKVNVKSPAKQPSHYLTKTF